MVLQEGASTWKHVSSIPGLLSSASPQHLAIQPQPTQPAKPAIVPSSDICVSGKVSEWSSRFSPLHGLKGRVVLGVAGFTVLCVTIVCWGYLTGEIGSHTTTLDTDAQAQPPQPSSPQPSAQPQQVVLAPSDPPRVDPWQGIDLTNGERIDDFVRIKPNHFLETKKQFACPIDVSLVIGQGNIRLLASHGALLALNWNNSPPDLLIMLPDSSSGGWATGTPIIAHPVVRKPTTWYKLRWLLAKEGISVFIDDNLVFNEKGIYTFSQERPVRVESVAESVVDIKSLQVRALPAIVRKQKSEEKLPDVPGYVFNPAPDEYRTVNVQTLPTGGRNYEVKLTNKNGGTRKYFIETFANGKPFSIEVFRNNMPAETKAWWSTGKQSLSVKSGAVTSDGFVTPRIAPVGTWEFWNNQGKTIGKIEFEGTSPSIVVWDQEQMAILARTNNLYAEIVTVAVEALRK